MSWSVPLFRASGVLVRVHILFIIAALGLFLRQVGVQGNPIWWVDVLLVVVVLPFVIILLHEFGHCFGARSVDGDAKEILMWPLGGLAFVEVPHTARANWVATAAGPAVNVLICVVCAAAVATAGFLPNLNPLAHPYKSETKNFRDGRVYTSPYGLRVYQPGTKDPVPQQAKIDAIIKNANRGAGLQERTVWKPETAELLASTMGGERAVAPAWVTLLNRTFTLSWFLFLINLIPAYPLDGGRLLQCYIWKRSDYRRGTTVAAYSGYVCAVLFLVAAIWQNESMLGLLALFILYESARALQQLDAEEGPFGYDFSAGYTSLEKDDPPPPRPKRPGVIARWRQARMARKIAREEEQRRADDEQMDVLLEKIARSGKESLTDDERRVLERVSARYRNRS